MTETATREPPAVVTPESSLIEKAVAILSLMFGGEHNVNQTVNHFESSDPLGHRVEVSLYGDLATFDFNRLTALVVGAHDFCCRVEILQGPPRHVKVMFTDRRREGEVTRRHPTIEEAISKVRESRWYGRAEVRVLGPRIKKPKERSSRW